MPKQAGRKSAVIVSFLLDVPTLKLIDEICLESLVKCQQPLNRSTWIKRAIARELAHRERSRKPKKPKLSA
jgi:hypothetical protein